MRLLLKGASNKMKIKKEVLRAYLDKYQITAADLARDMGVKVSAIETLLSGGAVDEPTARVFIYYFGADAFQFAGEVSDGGNQQTQNQQDPDGNGNNGDTPRRQRRFCK